MEIFIAFGIVVIPLILIGLFSMYKAKKEERKEQEIHSALNTVTISQAPYQFKDLVHSFFLRFIPVVPA